MKQVKPTVWNEYVLKTIYFDDETMKVFEKRHIVPELQALADEFRKFLGENIDLQFTIENKDTRKIWLKNNWFGEYNEHDALLVEFLYKQNYTEENVTYYIIEVKVHLYEYKPEKQN